MDFVPSAEFKRQLSLREFIYTLSFLTHKRKSKKFPKALYISLVTHLSHIFSDAN